MLSAFRGQESDYACLIPCPRPAFRCCLLQLGFNFVWHLSFKVKLV